MWRAWIRSWKSQHAREAALQRAKKGKRTFGMYFSTKTPPFEKSVCTAEGSFIQIPRRGQRRGRDRKLT